MSGNHKLFHSLGRVMSRSSTAGTALAFPLFALLAVVGSNSVIADNVPTNTQACQQQYQTERALCNSLTGQARAACQRQAAERFRMCRGQASPTQAQSLVAPQSFAVVGGATPAGTPIPEATRAANSRSSPKWLLRLQRTAP